MRAIYDAGKQLVKVRVMIWASLLCFLGAVPGAIYILQPPDGEQLAPMGERLGLSAVIIAVALLFFVGMAIYGRCYIARLELDDEAHQLRIVTVGLLGPIEHMVDARRRFTARRNSGRSEFPASGIRVDAPYRTIRLPGRKLPLLLDEQGEFLDEKRVRSVFRDAA